MIVIRVPGRGFTPKIFASYAVQRGVPTRCLPGPFERKTWPAYAAQLT
jgi:hypothetical protein